MLSWCPWPWRLDRESSEPDRAVGARTEQPLSPLRKCPVVKKQNKKPTNKKNKGNENLLCIKNWSLSRFRELWALLGLSILVTDGALRTTKWKGVKGGSS